MSYSNPEYNKIDQKSPEFLEANAIVTKIDDLVADGDQMGAIKFVMDLLTAERKKRKK